MTWCLPFRRQLFRGVVGAVLILAAIAAFGQEVVAPPPGSVTVRQIAAMGNGCPEGSFIEAISEDNLSFTLAFSEYIAEIGPGVSRRERRKTCNIAVDLDIPAGFQFTVVDVDYRGFVDLDPHVSGALESSYFFQGQQFANVSLGHVFNSGDELLAENYEVRDTFATITLSQCGGGQALIFDTEVYLRRLPGSTSETGGALTVDTITGTFDQKFALVWEEC